MATTCGLRLGSTQVVLTRAELELRGIDAGHGTLDAAQALAGEALRLAIERGYRREEGLAHRLLGRCCVLRSEPLEAGAQFRAALDLQNAMGAVLEAERTRSVMADGLAIGAVRA